MSYWEWFDKKLMEVGVSATTSQLENFKERVAIMHIDGCIEIDRARVLAFNRIMGVML